MIIIYYYVRNKLFKCLLEKFKTPNSKLCHLTLLEEPGPTNLVPIPTKSCQPTLFITLKVTNLKKMQSASVLLNSMYLYSLVSNTFSIQFIQLHFYFSLGGGEEVRPQRETTTTSRQVGGGGGQGRGGGKGGRKGGVLKWVKKGAVPLGVTVFMAGVIYYTFWTE